MKTTIHLNDDDQRWLSGDWTGFEFSIRDKLYKIIGPDEKTKVKIGERVTYADWHFTVDGHPQIGWLHLDELKARWLDYKMS